MADFEEFEELEFVIPAYTPDTMPLDRLLQYLEQIATLVDAPHDMHLIRIERSSAKPVFKMPVPAAIRAREQITNVRSGKGTVQQRVANDKLRQMVRRDGGTPAALNDRNGILIAFQPEEVVEVLSLRQPTVFDGHLLRIGGAGDLSAVLMQGLNGETVSGFVAPKTLAKAMAPLLFEPLRLSGVGNWDRSAQGDWKLSKMFVQSFDALDDKSLSEIVADLQKAPVVWPPDADELMRAERAGAQ